MGVEDGVAEGGHFPQKILEKNFRAKIKLNHVELGHFVNFLAYHVKLEHFVNFSRIHFEAKTSSPKVD